MRTFCVKDGCKGDCYRCVLVELVKEKLKVVILDDNPLSIACYLEEFGGKFNS